MPDTIAPNPPSPFADADPAFRHLIPVFALLGAAPAPGVLALAGCSRLTVVPDEVREALSGDALPEGLCPECLTAMRRGDPGRDARPSTGCRTCDSRTQHDGVCALCRQEMHADWVVAGRPAGVTLDQTVEQTLADAVAEQQADAGGDR